MINIMPFEKKYAAELKLLMIEFYDSDAVMSAIKANNFDNTIKLLLNKTPFQHCFILESMGKVVGYALIAITYSNEAGGMVAWLDEFFINSEERGKGVGKQFLSFMLQEYSDFGRLRLEVDRNNNRAEALYKSFDYKILPYKQMYKELN